MNCLDDKGLAIKQSGVCAGLGLWRTRPIGEHKKIGEYKGATYTHEEIIKYMGRSGDKDVWNRWKPNGRYVFMLSKDRFVNAENSTDCALRFANTGKQTNISINKRGNVYTKTWVGEKELLMSYGGNYCLREVYEPQPVTRNDAKKEGKRTPKQRKYIMRWLGPLKRSCDGRHMMPGAASASGQAAWADRPIIRNGPLRGCLDAERMTPWSNWTSEKVVREIQEYRKESGLSGRDLRRHCGMPASGGTMRKFLRNEGSRRMKVHWAIVVFLWWIPQQDRRAVQRRNYIARHCAGNPHPLGKFITVRGDAPGWAKRPRHRGGPLKGLLDVKACGKYGEMPPAELCKQFKKMREEEVKENKLIARDLAAYMGITKQQLSKYISDESPSTGYSQAHWAVMAYMATRLGPRRRIQARKEVEERKKRRRPSNKEGRRMGEVPQTMKKKIRRNTPTKDFKYPGVTKGGKVRYNGKFSLIRWMQSVAATGMYTVRWKNGSYTDMDKYDVHHIYPEEEQHFTIEPPPTLVRVTRQEERSRRKGRKNMVGKGKNKGKSHGMVNKAARESDAGSERSMMGRKGRAKSNVTQTQKTKVKAGKRRRGPGDAVGNPSGKRTKRTHSSRWDTEMDQMDPQVMESMGGEFMDRERVTQTVEEAGNEAEAEHEIESIIGKHTAEDGSWTQYKCRFKGYGPEEDLWFYKTTPSGCERLIRSYENELRKAPGRKEIIEGRQSIRANAGKAQARSKSVQKAKRARNNGRKRGLRETRRGRAPEEEESRKQRKRHRSRPRKEQTMERSVRYNGQTLTDAAMSVNVTQTRQNKEDTHCGVAGPQVAHQLAAGLARKKTDNREKRLQNRRLNEPLELRARRASRKRGSKQARQAKESENRTGATARNATIATATQAEGRRIVMRRPQTTTIDVPAEDGTIIKRVIANDWEGLTNEEHRHWGLIRGAKVRCEAYRFGETYAEQRYGGGEWRDKECIGVIQREVSKNKYSVLYEDGTTLTSVVDHLELAINPRQYRQDKGGGNAGSNRMHGKRSE